jgi:uncharacterized repeat protein (TIGR04052 family)
VRWILFLSFATACGPGPVSIAFEGLVGGEPARCGETYSGIGTTGTDLTLNDLRLYVHDVRLVTGDDREVPLELTQDGRFQYENLALLDFEDGSTGCESGTEALNVNVRGTPSTEGPFTGVRMTLGVPFDLNHIDASTAPAPLNFTSMFWSWNNGYKFLRVDARTTGLPDGYVVHLGSTGCEGDGRGNVTSCVQENRVEIALDDFDPDVDVIRIDLADLLSESDADADAGGQAGCMGGFDDPDCEAIFHGLGLPFDGTPARGAQRLFSVRHVE